MQHHFNLNACLHTTQPITMSFDPVEADKNDPLNWTRDEFELPLRAESGGKGESSLPGISSLSLSPRSTVTKQIDGVV